MRMREKWNINYLTHIEMNYKCGVKLLNNQLTPTTYALTEVMPRVIKREWKLLSNWLIQHVWKGKYSCTYNTKWNENKSKSTSSFVPLHKGITYHLAVHSVKRFFPSGWLTLTVNLKNNNFVEIKIKFLNF